MASNPELRSAYAQIELNPFWIEYRKRITALREAAMTSIVSQPVKDQADIWNIAKNQGAVAAFRTAISLPETMLGAGSRPAEGK
jgi:hypothetical protein